MDMLIGHMINIPVAIYILTATLIALILLSIFYKKLKTKTELRIEYILVSTATIGVLCLFFLPIHQRM